MERDESTTIRAAVSRAGGEIPPRGAGGGLRAFPA